MIREKNQLRIFISIFILLVVILIYHSSTQAAYWTAMPPYNTLWPLWSPALSPPDPFTGLPSPLITHLDRDTILPVQPALAWDPSLNQPYLLYNLPFAYFGGLLYFNQLFGFNSWPPPELIDPVTRFPMPIPLPLGYAMLQPTDYNLLADLVSLANNMFTIRYGVPLTNLLTGYQIYYGL